MFQVNSLFVRTFGFISVSMTIVMIWFSYYAINHKEEALIDVINSKAKTIAKSIALVSSDAMVTEDYSFIVEHNEKVIQDNKEIEYLLVTKKNADVNVVSNKNGWTIEEELSSEIIKTQLKEETAYILQSELSNNIAIYHFSYPILFSGIEWGWVAVGYSIEEYHQSIKKQYYDSLFLLLITLCLSLVFSYFLTRWLVRPIVLLQNAAKRVSLGDLNAKVDITSHDEVGKLAHSFNDMVETIKVSNKKLLRSNDELEKRVDKRTKELYELNISLDKKVKDELKKRLYQEQMLIHQSRFAAMGEMIGNIAHQWRQPLNALGLLLQNIESAYEMDMLDKNYIDKTVEKGNRLTNTMSQTIDDFRNFFKPNKEATIFSVISAVQSTVDMLKSSFASSMISIHYEIDKELCIKGFSSEFSQVILNILNNAKDALIENNSKDKEIFITTHKEDEYVVLEITDNGGGIPMKILNSIFDPYFTTKEEGKGTGIGLYMSKTIIENNMNGQLSGMNSKTGATFSIKMRLEVCNEAKG